MKKVIVNITLCLLVLGVEAQNLVPNYSFEDTIHCITTYNQFSGYVKNWTGGGGVSYLTSKCSGYEAGVPSNGYGHQYAHSGAAYAAIVTFMDSIYDPPHANDRGYIQDSLTNPLVGGTRYYATFYVSLADSMKYACNNMGAYFSDSALVYHNGNGKVKSYLTPQVTNDIVHHPLTDKVNWMKISGSFVAAGGEQYIVIGNFVNDAHVDTIFVNSVTVPPNNNPSAYYYIDDVIVSTDSTYADSLYTSVNEIKPVKVSVKVYPNPTNNLLNVSIAIPKGESGFTICLYNSEGGRVMCETLANDISTFSIHQLSSGIYYYRIMDGTGNLVKADKVTIIH